MAIIGANYSTLSGFIDELAAIHGVSVVAMASTNPTLTTLTRASGNFFLTAFPDSFQGFVMAKHAVDKLSAKSAAVVFWSHDTYSKGLAESFRDSFSELGGTVVAYQGYSYETSGVRHGGI